MLLNISIIAPSYTKRSGHYTKEFQKKVFKKIFCGAFVSISDIPDTNDNPRSGKYQMCPLTADEFQKQVVHKQLVQIQIVKTACSVNKYGGFLTQKGLYSRNNS